MAVSLSFSVPNEPGVYFEIDPSLAGVTAQNKSKILVMGPKLAGGTAAADTPIFVPSESAIDTMFGAGSIISTMLHRVKQNYPAGELWALPQADPAGAAATKTLTISASSAKAGVIPLYLGGELVQVAVKDDDTAAEIATAIKQKVNENTSLQVIATAADAVVTLTFKHVGTIGNGYDTRLSYHSETLAPGVGVVIAEKTAGSGVSSVTSSLAALGDVEYDTIIHPYTDSGTLLAIKEEMASRWGALRGVYGLVNSAISGTYSELVDWAIASGPNDPYTTILGVANSPTPNWVAAAAFGALTASAQMDAPDSGLAQGFSGLTLVGVLPAAKGESLTIAERNILLNYGLATMRSVGGTCYLSRARTTYRFDTAGNPDVSLYEQRTLAILMRIVRQDRNDFLREFGGLAMAQAGGKPGAKLVTPETVRGWFVARYLQRQDNLLVQNAVKFVKELVIEIDSQNPNQINVFYPPNLTSWLAVLAGRVAFRLI